MNRPRHRLLPTLALALGLAASVIPGRAQESAGRYFFFADTTLLRDTLGLHFDGLFELADSLRMLPDTLRALSIRYRFPLERMVMLADSLGVEVDSVGPILDRERFNPLATNQQYGQTFGYTSTYNIGQTSTTWINGAGYSLIQGPLFLRNTTNINMDRFDVGGRVALRETRNSVTELGWKFSDNLSLGGRANLDRFDTIDPGSLANEGEVKNEFQLSARSKQRPTRGLTSEINLFSGVLDLSNSLQEKRGLSGDLNGRARYARGWLTHDLTGQFTGNMSRTRLPGELERQNTQDYSQNIRGTMGVNSSGRVGTNLNYGLRKVLVETPRDSGRTQQVLTDEGSADLATRVSYSPDQQLNLGGRFATRQQSNTSNPAAQTSRQDLGFSTDARFLVAGWRLEPRFAITWSKSEFPRRSNAGGHGESLSVRTFDISAQRPLTERLVARATASVSLSQFRYFSLGGEPPDDRDQYRQNYRVDANYTYNQAFNTGAALDVSRDLFINIPSASTGANTETRTYRAEWRWSFLILQGLTVTQNNQILADYRFYTFIPENNRLSMDYTSRTNLAARFSRQLSLDVIHSSRFQPSGDYLRAPDGEEYFSPADETENLTLSASLNYSPSQVFSINIAPLYQATDRLQTVDGVEVPQRESRALNLTGGANVNIPVTTRGRLTGALRRTFRGDRTTTYTSGTPTQSPRGEIDFWNGSLNFTWDL
jgi:hypothetical protein